MTRLLGGTEKRNMHKVAKYFQETNGKPLVEELKDELNGTFLKASCRMSSHLRLLGSCAKYAINVDPVILSLFCCLLRGEGGGGGGVKYSTQTFLKASFV